MTKEEIAIEALKRIKSPITFMQNELQKDEQLNGQYAIQLANDAKYLQSIAEKALTEISSLPSVDLIKKAHSHGWMVRERYTGPDRHGYEDRLPANWIEMDYDEHEEWFCEQFLSASLPQSNEERQRGWTIQSSTSEEEKELWGQARSIVIKHFASYNYPSQAIDELQSKFKISKI